MSASKVADFILKEDNNASLTIKDVRFMLKKCMQAIDKIDPSAKPRGGRRESGTFSTIRRRSGTWGNGFGSDDNNLGVPMSTQKSR